MFFGVFLPLRALVIHRVLQAVPVFVMGGVIARVRVPRAPVLVQVLESGQVSIIGCVKSTCVYSKQGCSLAPTSAALHSPGEAAWLHT